MDFDEPKTPIEAWLDSGRSRDLSKCCHKFIDIVMIGLVAVIGGAEHPASIAIRETAISIQQRRYFITGLP